MNRPFYTSVSSSSSNRQPVSQVPPPPRKTSVQDRYHHSRNTSDPQDYHRKPPPAPLQRYEEEDTQDTDEEEDESEMTAYGARGGVPNNPSPGNSGSRPGSSHKDSGAAVKKAKTKSNKVFQCTGYGDCTMQFTRSEHLARHIRFECLWIILTLENIRVNALSIAIVEEILVVLTIYVNI